MVVSRLFYNFDYTSFRERILTYFKKPLEKRNIKIESGRRSSALSATPISQGQGSKIKLKDHSISDIYQRLKGLVGLNFLLGLSWGFALFGFSNENKIIIWIFVLLNSTQGFWIFIFYCIIRKDVREFYKSLCCISYLDKPRKLPNQGNQSHSYVTRSNFTPTIGQDHYKERPKNLSYFDRNEVLRRNFYNKDSVSTCETSVASKTVSVDSQGPDKFLSVCEASLG